MSADIRVKVAEAIANLDCWLITGEQAQAAADAAIVVIRDEVLKTIPGGQSCDPQQVADGIRRLLGWEDTP